MVAHAGLYVLCVMVLILQKTEEVIFSTSQHKALVFVLFCFV